ncbi:4-(gamma-L-glutamylamino)butanoyl-[BtrI acyl-carrier protein] monooxygenase BtrO [Streptomyces chrestomyceticus JCM 4735]|uniref:4-(Gamma-L-glutamylamino)butanoyl-[BtrI acyl-carrier protein] monooxygenase BtrO n=1 Tax=Streptomyces chrestomyceticus JCM 4735 TaxID=1306181 RepID=A0A7U9KP46_9ACTN|nr:4-(gamma-L-glutamylamino)butanoyl-[BtrI acyl-carrier protein] monooxygenase BtrO [Streptomyces chrestomyceticus JCM 4735]
MQFPGGGQLEEPPGPDGVTDAPLAGAAGDRVRLLVVKCLSDETGEDPDAIVARGHLDVGDRDYANIVNRLESYFDCSLDLLADGNRRLVVDDLCDRLGLLPLEAVHV